MSMFRVLISAAALACMTLAMSSPSLALPSDPVRDAGAYNETGCAYCESYTEATTEVESAWHVRMGYDAPSADRLREPVFVAETSCAYCADYTEAKTEIVASSWKPGMGYDKPVRRALAGWWFW